MRSLPIQVAAELTPLGPQMLTTGRQYGLSAYDASYLQLAMEKGLPLATSDKALLNAAKRAGVAVFTG